MTRVEQIDHVLLHQPRHDALEVEAELRSELHTLAERFGEILERAEPGWHRVTARLRAQGAKSELGRTLGGVEELLSDLNEKSDVELLITKRDGRLEIRAPVTPALPESDLGSDD